MRNQVYCRFAYWRVAVWPSTTHSARSMSPASIAAISGTPIARRTGASAGSERRSKARTSSTAPCSRTKWRSGRSWRCPPSTRKPVTGSPPRRPIRPLPPPAPSPVIRRLASREESPSFEPGRAARGSSAAPVHPSSVGPTRGQSHGSETPLRRSHQIGRASCRERVSSPV